MTDEVKSDEVNEVKTESTGTFPGADALVLMRMVIDTCLHLYQRNVEAQEKIADALTQLHIRAGDYIEHEYHSVKG